MNRVIFLYLIAALTYLAIKSALTGIYLAGISRAGLFFVGASFIGIVIEFAHQLDSPASSRTRVTVCRIIVWLNMFLLVVSEAVESVFSIDLNDFINVSQVSALSVLAICFSLIPREKENLQSNKPTEYEQHGGMR